MREEEREREREKGRKRERERELHVTCCVFQTVRKEMDNFYKLYAKWRGGISDDLVWGNIRPLPETMLQVRW